MILDKVLEDINHGQKRMKYIEGALLGRQYDCDNLYTITKKPKSAFFFRENVVFASVQLESKKGHFELTNEELLMIN